LRGLVRINLDGMKDPNARAMRHSATDAEHLLWSGLRSRRLGGFKFCRQHPIEPFIVDFACTERMLTVEADGGQHAESAGDVERTAKLERAGWSVLRFWNNEILTNLEGVLATILAKLRE
jgi:very-short-patch-repair endonuclease